MKTVFVFTIILFFIPSLVFAQNLDEFIQILGVETMSVKAPIVNLESFSGEKVKLNDYLGKIVFLNFWATWCVPCRIEMPSLEKLYREFKDDDFVVLGISQDSSSEIKNVKEYIREFNLTFPNIFEINTDASLKFSVSAIPATFVLDKKGIVVGSMYGARDWTSDIMKAFVKLLLSGQVEIPKEDIKTNVSHVQAKKEGYVSVNMYVLYSAIWGMFVVIVLVVYFGFIRKKGVSKVVSGKR